MADDSDIAALRNARDKLLREMEVLKNKAAGLSQAIEILETKGSR